MSYEFIRVEKKDAYAVITLDRPKVNSFSLELITEVGEAVRALEADDAVGAIVITGAGEKFFSAGADIPTLQASLKDPLAAGTLLPVGLETMAAIENCSKPVIAAVNGIAMGGGCEICLACHLRVASETAKFGQPEINLGIIPGWGGTHRLPRLIGESKAMDWLLTGRTFDAQEALAAGLVCRVAPPDKLMEVAGELAAVCASKPAVARKATLDVVRGCTRHPEQGEALEAEAFKASAASADAAEGVAAFLEKREAKFTGK